MAGNLGSGRGGISDQVEGRVRRLLSVGIPKSEIARKLRISRNTVHRIHNGAHRQNRAIRPQRCTGCGGLCVQEKCLVCPDGTPLRKAA